METLQNESTKLSEQLNEKEKMIQKKEIEVEGEITVSLLSFVLTLLSCHYIFHFILFAEQQKTVSALSTTLDEKESAFTDALNAKQIEVDGIYLSLLCFVAVTALHSFAHIYIICSFDSQK